MLSMLDHDIDQNGLHIYHNTIIEGFPKLITPGSCPKSQPFPALVKTSSKQSAASWEQHLFCCSAFCQQSAVPGIDASPGHSKCESQCYSDHPTWDGNSTILPTSQPPRSISVRHVRHDIRSETGVKCYRHVNQRCVISPWLIHSCEELPVPTFQQNGDEQDEIASFHKKFWTMTINDQIFGLPILR